MVLNITEIIKNNNVKKVLNVEKYLRKKEKKENDSIILYFSENTLIEIYYKKIKKIILPNRKNLEIKFEIDIVNFANRTVDVELLFEFLKLKIVHTCTNYEKYSIHFNSKYNHEILNLLENFIPRKKTLFSKKILLKNFTLVFHKFQNYTLDLSGLYITEYLYLEGFKAVKGTPKTSPNIIYLENILEIRENFIRKKKNIEKIFIHVLGSYSSNEYKFKKFSYNKNFLNDIIKKTRNEFVFANYDKIKNKEATFLFDNFNAENIENLNLYSPDTKDKTVSLKNLNKVYVELFKSNVENLNLFNINKLDLSLYNNKIKGIISNIKDLEITLNKKTNEINQFFENIELKNIKNLKINIEIDLQENIEKLIDLFLSIKDVIVKLEVKENIDINITKRSYFDNPHVIEIIEEIETTALKNIRKEEYNQIFENLIKVFIKKFNIIINLGFNFRNNKKIDFLLQECKNDKIIKQFNNRLKKLDTLISQI